MTYMWEPAKNCALIETETAQKLEGAIFEIKGLINMIDVDENGNAVSSSQQSILNWLRDCLKEAESQLETTRQHGKYWLDKYKEFERMIT